jgi:L-ascorbate metabolism protein UlaG (beta-lactamase superfamily)
MPGPYRNASGEDVNGWQVLRWIATRTAQRLPRPPMAPVRGIAPDLAFIRGNRATPAATWVGHSTVLLQVAGVNILTDPVFSRFASPVPFGGPRRHQPPGLALGELPRIDVVLLSHIHYDHLDRPSVRALARQPGGPPLFLVPAGVERWFAANVSGMVVGGAGETVRGFEWNATLADHPRAPGLTFDFLRVQHWSNRSPFSRNDTPWGSWAIRHRDFSFWFSGDLGYSADTAAIGQRFGGFDAAAIAIGAYEPRWFMKGQHCNPDEAVQIMHEVGAREAFAIHWGTFELTDESLDQPPRDLAAALAARGVAAERFRVLRHGETRRYAASPMPALPPTHTETP